MTSEADECRRRAADCVRNAFNIRDETLRQAYFQLARHWRAMAAPQIESRERMRNSGRRVIAEVKDQIAAR
jgi:hypothetical protein